MDGAEYDQEAARARFLELGCSPQDADTLVSAGLDPDLVGDDPSGVVPFANAAVYHDLQDANGYLEAAGGDPDRAWEEWARNDPETRWQYQDDEDDEGEEDDEEYEDDEDDEDDDGSTTQSAEDGEDEDEEYEEYEDDVEIYGTVSAYIAEVSPGELSIDLIDDLGMPGNATFVKTVTFSFPAAGPEDSQAGRDALVIKAATEALVEHGCIPDSDFRGRDGGFTVEARAHHQAAEWLEAQRSPAEKLERLLAELERIHRGDPTVAGVRAVHSSATIGAVREPAPPEAGTPSQDTDQVRVVDWVNAEGFLEEVAGQRPATVYIERRQGGYAACVEDWEDTEHPSIPALDRVWAEAEQRDQELSGFTAEFRSAHVVHRYLVRADWAAALEERLEQLHSRVTAARQEQAHFPQLQEWAERLYAALAIDEQFIAAQTATEAENRAAEMARTMFGPAVPMKSWYIQRSLTKANVTRRAIAAERRQAEAHAAALVGIPLWAAQLAARPDFRTGTTAERAMLASNLLYAHNPAADTAELVRSLQQAAAGHLD